MKLCILAAGQGSRLTADLIAPHKALVNLGQKAAITRILEKFSSETEVVIALGHNSELLRDYLAAAHSERRLQFVDVQLSTGPGSGPGRSLWECRHLLSCPFVVCCVDTLWDDQLDFTSEKNEIFIGTYPDDNHARYCNIRYEIDQTVSAIYDKQEPPLQQNIAPFIGLAKIKNWEIFFNGLENATSVAGEIQISAGFSALLTRSHCSVQKVQQWHDTGTPENLSAALNFFGTAAFKKTGEDLYFINQRVIKFFADTTLSRQRIARAALDNDIHPPLVYAGKNFYAYNYIDGSPLRNSLNSETLTALLAFAKKNIWLAREEPKDREELCRVFYHEKTLTRLQAYRQKNSTELSEQAQQLFSKLKISEFSRLARFTRIHGDFQPDNILISDTEPRHFTLIDFRQDFAGRLELGDLYYDLGKMLAALMIDYQSLASGKTLSDIRSIQNFTDLKKALKDFTLSENLNWPHVQRVALVAHLSMLGLHEMQVADLLAQKILQLAAAAEYGERLFTDE